MEAAMNQLSVAGFAHELLKHAAMEKIAPFKSEAQRRLFYAKERRGEISKKTISKWESHTQDKKLPERLHKAGEEKNPKENIKDRQKAGLRALGVYGTMGAVGLPALLMRGDPSPSEMKHLQALGKQHGFGIRRPPTPGFLESLTGQGPRTEWGTRRGLFDPAPAKKFTDIVLPLKRTPYSIALHEAGHAIKEVPSKPLMALMKATKWLAHPLAQQTLPLAGMAAASAAISKDPDSALAKSLVWLPAVSYGTTRLPGEFVASKWALGHLLKTRGLKGALKALPTLASAYSTYLFAGLGTSVALETFRRGMVNAKRNREIKRKRDAQL
jgi:hypothetical protein